MTLTDWKKQVDAELTERAGITTVNLDAPWRYWFTSGMSPTEAAKTALINDGFPEDLF